jgi:hypothetical protein
MKDKFIDIERSLKWRILVFRISPDSFFDYLASLICISFGAGFIAFLFTKFGLPNAFSIAAIFVVMLFTGAWFLVGGILVNAFVEIHDDKSADIKTAIIKNMEFYDPGIIQMRGRNNLLIFKELGTFRNWNHMFTFITDGNRILINRSSLTDTGVRSPLGAIQCYLICRKIKRGWVSIEK